MSIDKTLALLPKPLKNSISAEQKQRIRSALNDMLNGILQWRVWLTISWQDIKTRYRRSFLGPFWLTISMCITIFAMGFLYGHLMQADLRQYFPYLASGLLTWGLISNILMDSPGGFIQAENYIKQIKLPYTMFIMRVVCRNLIIFAHTIVVIIPILYMYDVPITWATLMVIPGIFLIAVNGIFFGLILATLGARYRDIQQLMNSLVQVTFFLTPIIWDPKFLPESAQWVVKYNPMAYYVGLLRDPLYGVFPPTMTWLVVLSFTLIGCIMATLLFIRSKSRIIYWL